MPSTPHIRFALAAACAAAASLAAAAAAAAPASNPSPCRGTRVVAAATTRHALRLVRARVHLPAVAAAYGWPLKPFDRQHPVRAFLNDPRIGRRGSHAFHFGIDIAAPDGTPVYSVTGGTLYLGHGSLAVSVNGHHTFGYWHVLAAAGLTSHQVVRRHQLLGTIAKGWGHVHFAERIGGVYVNPLRRGGLGPYTDPVAPVVSGIVVTSTCAGRLDVLVQAHDTTWPRVPGTWTNEPVTPALLRRRVSEAGTTAGAWRTAVDLSGHMLDRHLFSSVYAPASSQNHEGRPGTYSFYVVHDWRPTDGAYRIQISASDTRGNTAVAGLAVDVREGAVHGS